MGYEAKWCYNSVTRILKNEIYTGTLAQGKQTTPNYKIKTRVMKPEEEWVKVEDTHEAIIPAKDFALVQELLAQDTRISPEKEALYPLAGLLYCGDCKEPMVRKTIPETELTETVLCLVQMHIEKVLTLEKAMEAIEKAPELKADVAKFDLRIRKKKGELEKAEKRKMNLYEDLKDGIITKKEYLQLKTEYDRRIGEAEMLIRSY